MNKQEDGSTNGIILSLFDVSLHHIILMQLLTPSAVAIADRIASAVCTTNFQNSLFFMVI